MIVYGTPNLVVNGWKKIGGRNKRIITLFKFDENGRAEIDETKISREALGRIKAQFRTEQPVKLEKKHKCKKCDYDTDNKGELLAHYREEHPKE